MAGEKGKAQPKYSDEQKIKIGFSICEMYESQQLTIESCADANGVTYRTFRLWCVQLSELSERYKKAKENQEADFWENVVRPLSKRAIERHLSVEFAEEESDVVYQGVKAKDEAGNPVKQRTKKWVLPNPSVTMFVAKGMFPGKFVQPTEQTVNINDKSEFLKLPLETRLAVLEIINKGKHDVADPGVDE